MWFFVIVINMMKFVKYDINLGELLIREYDKGENDYFTDIKQVNNQYLISGYSNYDNDYISKFITYTKSGKVLK